MSRDRKLFAWGMLAAYCGIAASEHSWMAALAFGVASIVVRCWAGDPEPTP